MRTAVAGVVLLAAAVAGCSGEDAAPAEVGALASGAATAAEAEVANTPNASRPASDSSVTAPVNGPPMEFAETVDGASAFARDYVRLIGEGFAGASSREVRRRTARGCEGCEALIGAIDEAARAGLKQRGGGFVVSTVATPPIVDGDVVLLLTYTRSASEILDASGVVVDRTPPVPATTVQMRLVYGPEGWRTQGYRIA